MTRAKARTVDVTYFSDVLCVWAFISQVRVDALVDAFGEQVRIQPRFVSIFGDTLRKTAANWGSRGGFDGFAHHLAESVAAFPEITVHADVWSKVRPLSSTGPHLFLKAAQLAEAAGELEPGAFDRLTRAFRAAFFAQARDIGRHDVRLEVARDTGVPVGPIQAAIDSGAAFAALATDYQEAGAMGVQGSPSFVLNEGRQKLYGNVGYRIIEANILELLREPHPDHASWC